MTKIKQPIYFISNNQNGTYTEILNNNTKTSHYNNNNNKLKAAETWTFKFF